MGAIKLMPHLLAAIFMLVAAGPVSAAPLMLFDQGHDQRFLIEQDGPLHLSQLAALMQEAGFNVRSTNLPLTEKSLAGVDVLVISGAFTGLSKPETEAVLAYLARGGRLALMLHIPQPVADLLHGLDVDFTNYVLSEQENLVDNDPRNFRVTNLASHPLFAAIDHFSLYGGWALINMGSKAGIIASTSAKGWVDLNGDGKLSKGDVVQAFGVLAEGTSGAGRFLVFGDDAIFQNKFLDQQNRHLARNLAKWLK